MKTMTKITTRIMTLLPVEVKCSMRGAGGDVTGAALSPWKGRRSKAHSGAKRNCG